MMCFKCVCGVPFPAKDKFFSVKMKDAKDKSYQGNTLLAVESDCCHVVGEFLPRRLTGRNLQNFSRAEFDFIPVSDKIGNVLLEQNCCCKCCNK